MRPVSELKAIAKRRMSKSTGLLAGATALTVLICFTLYMTGIAIMVMGIDFKTVDSVEDLIVKFSSSYMTLITYGISLIVTLLSALFLTGYKRICYIVAKDLKPSLSDLFFPIKYYPDKIILISFLVWIITTVGNLSSLLNTGAGGLSSGKIDGGAFFVAMVLEVVSAAILILINAYLFAGYYIYLDDPAKSVPDIIRESVQLMRGNVLKLIYLTLTFFGWFILVLFTYGIALIYVAPYLCTCYGLFFRDLKGELGNGYDSEA
ncbi:MAG: DUF975 family protein [Lachnospiraceae bacterium]|nr:DUF975 family protein [Lachnospiraceae bacterium]